MNRDEIKTTLAQLTKSIDSVTDPNIISTFKILLNLIEALVEENSVLKQENHKLKDEINRLKGEQGKPNIKKPTGSSSGNSNHSSEADRKKRHNKKNLKIKCVKNSKLRLTGEYVRNSV